MDSGTSYMLNKCSTMELQPGPMVWFLYALLVQRGRTTSPPPRGHFSLSGDLSLSFHLEGPPRELLCKAACSCCCSC